MEPAQSEATALRFAANVAEDYCQSYVPRDVLSAHSQWNTAEEDKIEQGSISG